MNKKYLLITLISISIFTVGCSKTKETESTTQTKTTTVAKTTTPASSTNNATSTEPSKSTSSNVASSSSVAYQISKNVYTNKNITINYPQITNLGDTNKQKSINEIIKSEALKVLDYYKGITDVVTLNINYDIKWKNENLLSLQYSGIGYSKGAAHPNNLLYTTNINLNKGTRLKLTDIVKVDQTLVNKFRGGTYKSQQADPDKSLQTAAKESVQQLTTADLIKNFNNADSLDNIGTVNQSDTFSYFTNDSLGISVPISVAAGDHAEFEIKYQDIQNTINAQNKYLLP